jgi:hypothetical protein
LEAVQRGSLTFAPDATVSQQDSSYFAAAEVGTEVLKCGAIEVRAEQIEQLLDAIALIDAAGDKWPAVRFGTKFGLIPVPIPSRHGSRMEFE